MKPHGRILGTLLLAACLLLPGLASAVSIGQTDNFEDGTTQNWIVGLAGAVPPFPPANIPTGGPAGDGDHYLLLRSVASTSSNPGNRLVVINQTQWTGNFLGAGVNFISMDVNNLGATDLDLRVRVEDPLAPRIGGFASSHVAVSTDAVLVPAGSGWTRVVFPMSPGHFTALKGDVTAALSNVADLRVFHSPTAAFPGPAIDAQLGVDRITARLTLMPPPADFDGDGKTDVGVWRPANGNWYVLRSSDGGVVQTPWGTGTFFATPDVPVPGDYDGDGKADYAVWRPSDGTWYVLRSSDGGVVQTPWGTGTFFATPDVPVPGDYDGDGKADCAVWRPSDGTWYVLRSSDGGAVQTPWGTGTFFATPDVPVPGDYDGDGKADYAVWRPSDGTWYLLRSSDGGVVQTPWGTGTFFATPDVPVPGDYDGDGKADCAVWRPSDGTWYVLRSSNGGVVQTPWGTGTFFATPDVPVPGDYDGDGKADYAVWRPSDGTWYVLRSSDGGSVTIPWGNPTDAPASQ